MKPGKKRGFTNIHVLRTVQKHRGRSLTDESLQYRSPPRTSPLGCGWPQGVASDGRAPVMVSTSLICCQGEGDRRGSPAPKHSTTGCWRWAEGPTRFREPKEQFNGRKGHGLL